MPNKQRIEQSLKTRLADDATILKDFGTLLGFFTVASGVVSPAAALFAAGVVKAAGASISAGSKILGKLGAPQAVVPPSSIPEYERFGALFYVLCQRSFLEALAEPDALAALKQVPNRRLDEVEVGALRERLGNAVAKIDESEIRYHYGVDPWEGPQPLLEALGGWLHVAIAAYVPSYMCQNISNEVVKRARVNVRLSLSRKEPPFEWMREYLTLSIQEMTLDEIRALSVSHSEMVRSLMATMNGWTDWLDPTLARQNHWKKYKERLALLLDQKDSMYDEHFGVRKVFVPPRGSYHRASQSPDQPDEVDDLARLLGALVSRRVRNDDLIFVCGGPGSGKSTLCRFIASQLSLLPDLHPVFLKLRRCQEGEELATFLQDSLVREGVITSLADLQDVPNLVLVLDGFDELVMASKTKLRHVFSALLEDLSSGPLKSARVIISGRDTLFPLGKGLPRDSHVVNVLPFGPEQVTLWGEKWRLQHPDGPGGTFHPEALQGRASSAVADLLAWPLTLHLVARLHTESLLDVRDTNVSNVEKSYLYRGILHQTARRQREQARGDGRLAPEVMRSFLRGVAWFMYERGVDSLEVGDVLPLVGEILGRSDEGALNELAEVAVVNCPEIQKGEETGFEFVHKSFAEFLVAETIAADVEGVIHRVPGLTGGDEWRRELPAAVTTMFSRLSPRMLTAEVQDMLEPMVGVFYPFSAGTKVEDRVPKKVRVDGLARVVERLSELYVSFAARAVVGEFTGIRLAPSLSVREAEANYGAGLVLVAAAASRQLQSLDSSVRLDLEPYDGALFQWLFALHCGGVHVDETLGMRLYSGTSVGAETVAASRGSLGGPLQIGLLSMVSGMGQPLPESLDQLERRVLDVVTRLTLVARSLEGPSGGADRREKSSRRPDFGNVAHFCGHAAGRVADALQEFYGQLDAAGLTMRREAGEMFSHQFQENLESLGDGFESGHSDTQELLRSYCGAGPDELLEERIPLARRSLPQGRPRRNVRKKKSRK